ncbi:deleted in malignant brain tumors 1 protein-like isoform X2 [Siniperca chuatsi]|uniref:deleted in malignant brain tumors 1 protein-like isoform X2 n=1 Tax=Siniperca chuatsi TaxID=119488 RepID=UPI001CE2132D|nr:deleted in malignant brain tumors 1 protein-like isoform X2 [Siniperca chuatsi]
MGSTQQRNLFHLIIVSLLFTLYSSASDGQVRLAGFGSTLCSGRVEIYHNTTWGTVCDDNWDLNDAKVLCRQLGCGTPLGAPPSAHFGEGTGQIWLDEIDCSGSESSLTECQHEGFGTHNCGHSEDAGVICSGVPIRLAGSTQSSGRVEIYYNNTWGTVCDNSWDLNDAEVVCRQLGSGTALSASKSALFGEGPKQIWLGDVDCSGHESSLTECQHGGFGTHNCSHSDNAGVVCSGVPIRLVGPTLCSGRVEIYYNNTWGTVCGDGWDQKDAEVVCRELGCRTALSFHFAKTPKQIWLSDVDCSGSERSLTECQHGGFGNHGCSHSKKAVVVCSAILPKPSIYINPVGEVAWGQNVSITCSISTPTQQLLHGTFTLNQTSGSFSQNQTSSTNSAPFSILKVDFYNEGLYQCQYSQHVSSPLSDSVKLSVTVPLQQPSISLTSPNRGLVWSSEGAEVTRGYSFVFTCSITSSYPEGRFFLIFSGSNITDTKPAVSHSASFNFPVAEHEHQGNYSCVYEVTLSSRKFTSTETAPVSVVIKSPLLLLVSSVAGGGLLLLLLVLLVVCLVLRRRRRAKQPGAFVQTHCVC